MQARWADLTDPAEVDRLIDEVSPAAVIHLAAVIPPGIYRNAKLARSVNVDATATLVRAVAANADPPRFVQASSNAVYGARNPHRYDEPVRANTAPKPCDLYSGHKLEAEESVRSSSLEWVVLRLGGVLSVDPGAMPFSSEALFFESALPTDGRLHSVDVRDVASAFAAATTADVVDEILLVAGDESHRIRQGEVGPALAAARGMPGILPAGRPGNPDSDDDWFVTDWMDSTRAQQALSLQQHSWPDSSPRCMTAQVGSATRCDSSLRSRGNSSNAVPPTIMRQAGTQTHGEPSGPHWGNRDSTPGITSSAGLSPLGVHQSPQSSSLGGGR